MEGGPQTLPNNLRRGLISYVASTSCSLIIKLRLTSGHIGDSSQGSVCPQGGEKEQISLSVDLPKARRVPGSWVQPELGVGCSVSDG